MGANFFRNGPRNPLPPSKHTSRRVVMELGYTTILICQLYTRAPHLLFALGPMKSLSRTDFIVNILPSMHEQSKSWSSFSSHINQGILKCHILWPSYPFEIERFIICKKNVKFQCYISGNFLMLYIGRF